MQKTEKWLAGRERATMNYRESVSRPRQDKVRILTREGRSCAEIASILGVTERTIERDRDVLGLVDHERPKREFRWNQHREWLARQLLSDGCPCSEVARTLGTGHSTVADRFRAEFPLMPRGCDPLASHRSLMKLLGLRLI